MNRNYKNVFKFLQGKDNMFILKVNFIIFVQSIRLLNYHTTYAKSKVV